MDELAPEITSAEDTSKKIRNVAHLILGIGAIILPFFVIPNPAFSLQISKGLLITISTLLALAVYLVSLIQEGGFRFPKNLFSSSVLFIGISAVVSAVLSGQGVMSYFGYGLEVGSAVFIGVSCIAFFLASQLYQDHKQTLRLYVGFLVSFYALALYQIIKIVSGGTALSFGFLSGTTANLIGNFNDFGVFVALILFGSLLALELMALKPLMKVVAYVTLALSVLLLAIVNFSTLWIVIAAFSLLFFLYMYMGGGRSYNEAEERVSRARTISWKALSVCVVAIVFIIFGQSIGQNISGFFNTNHVEVRPSWEATSQVAYGTLKDHLFFGSGPNTFASDWFLQKSRALNESIFWDSSFSSGIGLIPTYVATTGIVGALWWVLLIGLMLLYGIRALFYRSADTTTRFLLVSSFLLSAFLLVMSVVYVPSTVNSYLTLFFIGLFCAQLYSVSLLKQKTISFSHYPKLSFVAVVTLIVLLIGTITLGYTTLQKNVSQIVFQGAVIQYGVDKDLVKAERTIMRAISIEPYDMFYRGLTELNLIRLSSLLSQQGISQKDLQTGFQTYVSASIVNGQNAIKANPRSYQNYLVLAQVYGSLVPKPLSIPGAYESARDTYEKALGTNPHSPAVQLQLARLEVSKGDLKLAREFTNKAIAEKQNFAEAHFLLAQIEATEGRLLQSIDSLQTTILLLPLDAGLLFQLGLLKYNNKDFAGSAKSFEQAIALASEYANAKYFLGLAYVDLGRTPDAIIQFIDLANSNPESAEVLLILENLKAGRGAFANAKAPIDSNPEKRKELPLKQKN